ncbi:hypothetical protein ACNRDG_24555 [Ralstonia pseudosolanacearum]|uniref:hypothetical protein n=1 Tax=Ralstonia pseudosolanacearum TaxID=1310165 RepID=UPI003AAB9F71
MKKTKPSPKKQGRVSSTQRGQFICQEIVSRRLPGATLEVQTASGEVVSSFALQEPTAGHQITPDGQWVYALMGGQVSEVGILRRLVAVDVGTGAVRDVDVSTSALPAVDDEFVAYFEKDAIVVRKHDGTQVFGRHLDRLGVLHGGAAHACTLLPNGRVAISCGLRADEMMADLTLFDISSGREEQRIELPVASSYGSFVPAALRTDPRGELVAILGFHAGLSVVDLERGTDVADTYPPDPLDLAGGQPTRHAHHTYSDLAFDAVGDRVAVVYRPGCLSVWSRNGDVLRQESIATNPKAQRIVTFGKDEVAFFDSMGERAIIPVHS